MPSSAGLTLASNHGPFATQFGAIAYTCLCFCTRKASPVLKFPLYRRFQLGCEEARPGRRVNGQRSVVSALMVAGLIVSKSLSDSVRCASRHLGLTRG